MSTSFVHVPLLKRFPESRPFLSWSSVRELGYKRRGIKFFKEYLVETDLHNVRSVSRVPWISRVLTLSQTGEVFGDTKSFCP